MIELNEQFFDEGTREGLVLVDFFANWCGPCRAISPTLEQLKGIKVVKVDTDESPNLAVRFKVSSIPCLVIMKDGVEVDRMIGVQSLQMLQERVDKWNVEASFS